MYNSAVSSFILKVHKPVFSLCCMNPATLMRPVYVAFSLFHHYFTFIRTIWRLRPHGKLETCWYTTCRTHNPIPSVALVGLWTFASTVLISVAIKHDHGFPYCMCSICRKFSYRQN